MIVVLDFGSTLNKAVVYEAGEFNFYKFSLSYVPQVFSAKNIIESFRRLEDLSGRKLLGEKEKPLGNFYLVYGLPLPSELPKLPFVKAVFATAQVLETWERPVLEVGSQFISFRQKLGVANYKTENLLKWLPFKITLSEVQNYLDNQKIYSNLLPIFPRDLYLEKALAREKLATLLEDIPKPGGDSSLVLSGGIFCACPFVAQSLNLFLDCFSQINDSVEVFLDPKNILSCLSVLKSTEPEIFEQIPLAWKPFSLGSVFHLPEGGALTIDLGLKEPLEVKILPESLVVFPLGEKEEARITLTSGKKNEESFKVIGGRLGLVVDSRRHPLVLPSDSARRMSLLKIWEEQLGATERSLLI